MLNRECLNYFQSSAVQLGVEIIQNSDSKKSEYLMVLDDKTFTHINVSKFHKRCPGFYLKSYSDFWDYLQRTGIKEFIDRSKSVFINIDFFNQLKVIAELNRQIINNFSKYIESVLISGSFLKNNYSLYKDIDLMIIIDDITYDISLEQKSELKNSLVQFVQKIPFNIAHINPLDISVNFNSEFFKGFINVDISIVNFLKDAFFIYDKGYWKRQREYLQLGMLSIPYNTLEERYISSGNAIFNLIPQELGKLFKYHVYDGVVMLIQGLLVHFKIYPQSPNEISKQLKILQKRSTNNIEHLMKLWEEFNNDIKTLSNPSVLGVKISIDNYFKKIEIAEHIKNIVNAIISGDKNG